MSESETRGRLLRRAMLIAAPFTAGAVLGAALLVSLDNPQSSAGSQSGPAQGVTARPGDVASTSPLYDAQTIYQKDSPGVVDITVAEAASQGTGGGLSPFVPGGSSQQTKAEGTGFVYDRNGDIVTAAHVVSGASKISVRFRDGTTAKATLVGADPSSDTAVIKVAVPASSLTPLALGDSSTVEPGEGVVAIGSPFGYAESITAGIVSAVNRDIQAPNGYAIPNVIQTDAAINHGNSGGPLIDASGKVIGVNVQIATDSQGGASDNAGVGFAVPSNAVKTAVNDLIAGRTVPHPYLGVSVVDPPSGSGAQVGTVRAGSPAASAGLKSGDIITKVDGVKVTSPDELTAIVSRHQPGDTLRLTVERSGSTLELEATLATRPATA
jgi:putative serine protease PepD